MVFGPLESFSPILLILTTYISLAYIAHFLQLKFHVNIHSLRSISAAIIEYTITAMYNKWANKNKIHQLKLTNRLSKANAAITTLINPNKFNLVYQTKQSYSPTPRSSNVNSPTFTGLTPASMISDTNSLLFMPFLGKY